MKAYAPSGWEAEQFLSDKPGPSDDDDQVWFVPTDLVHSVGIVDVIDAYDIDPVPGRLTSQVNDARHFARSAGGQGNYTHEVGVRMVQDRSQRGKRLVHGANKDHSARHGRIVSSGSLPDCAGVEPRVKWPARSPQVIRIPTGQGEGLGFAIKRSRHGQDSIERASSFWVERNQTYRVGGMTTPVWQRALACIALLVSSPVLIVSALAIRLSSRGPILFRSDRVGLNGSVFTMYKLRTMHHESGSGLSSITAGDDPRVFPIGRWLRRLKLDELPQLANVVRGEMGIVGPRPESPNIVREHYREWMLETLEVPPGVVGPGSLDYFLEEANMPKDAADAERFYVETLLPRKLARDLVYVRNDSFVYQAELVTRTILSIVGLQWICKRRQETEEWRARLILDEIEGDGKN